MNFRSSDLLFSRINKYLSAFTNSSDIDENDWYYYTKSVLKRLNVEGTSLAETVLVVDGYKTKLPEDFSSLWALWKTEGDNKQNTIYREHQQDKLIFYYEDTCLKKNKEGCFSSSFIPSEKEPNVIMRDVFIGEELVINERYKNTHLLKLANKKSGYCLEGCLNKQVKEAEEFTINENSISFGFKEGTVLLQYYAFVKDEDGLPLIPDDVRIEEAIESFIIYKELAKKFYSGEENVLQRMQYAELKSDEKYNIAKTHLHLPSWKNMIEYAYKNQTKNHKYINPEVRNPYSWWYFPFGTFNNFSTTTYRR